MLQRLLIVFLSAFLTLSASHAAEDVVRFEHFNVPMKHGIFTVHLSTYLYLPPG